MSKTKEHQKMSPDRMELCSRILEDKTGDHAIEPTKEVILVREPRHRKEEINLFELWLVLKRRWVWIILPSIILPFFVGFYSYTRPRFYAAQATVVPPIELIQGARSVGSGLGGLQRSLLSNIMGDSSLSEMYVGILESRTITEGIVERFNLNTVYEIGSVADAITMLKSRSAFKVRKDGIISIQVTDLDPSRASAMANAFVEELDLQNRRLSGGSVTSKRKFLETRLKELQQELSSIDQIPAHEAKIKEMIFEMLSQEYELARIQEARSMPTIQVLDSAVVPERGISRGTLRKAQLAGLITLVAGILVAFAYEHVTGRETNVDEELT